MIESSRNTNNNRKLQTYDSSLCLGFLEYLRQREITRTVDGVKRTYVTIVQDMGQNVGKLQDHSTDTNILTIIFDVTEGNPIINNAFPEMP
jgi:hypothetical protein